MCPWPPISTADEGENTTFSPGSLVNFSVNSPLAETVFCDTRAELA